MLIEERTKAKLEQAWWIAVLHRIDHKTFPRSASALWKKGSDAGPEQSIEEMVAGLEARYKAQEQRKAAKERAAAKRQQEPPKRTYRS